jgi:hypothetical protein
MAASTGMEASKGLGLLSVFCSVGTHQDKDIIPQIAARTSPSPSRLRLGSLMPINEVFSDGGDDGAEH